MATRCLDSGGRRRIRRTCVSIRRIHLRSLPFMNAREHADRWLAAWNAHDLEAVLECYAEDVDFAAPTVVRRFGRPDGRLHGRGELREHFAKGLSMAPGLRFTEEALLTGPAG